ncbi:MAG: hypothetical protein ACOYT8_04415 [Candidatus Dependentiae bacterium]
MIFIIFLITFQNLLWSNEKKYFFYDQEQQNYCNCIHNNQFIQTLLENNPNHQKILAICICGGLRFHYDEYQIPIINIAELSAENALVQKPINYKAKRANARPQNIDQLDTLINFTMPTWKPPYTISLSNSLLLEKKENTSQDI